MKMHKLFAFHSKKPMKSSIELTPTTTIDLGHQSFMVPSDTGLRLLTDISLHPTSIGSKKTLHTMQLRMATITPWTVDFST